MEKSSGSGSKTPDRFIPPNLPPDLVERDQWCLWCYEVPLNNPGGDPTKVLYQLNGRKGDSTKPRTWARASDAWEAYRYQLVRSDGVGYVFSPEDPFCGIDLDDVWSDSDDDNMAPWAAEILERFADTYWEESPGLNGAKIWCRGKLPERCGHNWKIGRGAVEIYDRARYFTVTARSGGPPVITDHQADIDSLIRYLDGGVRPQPVAIGDVIPYGTQHHMLVSLAGTMRRRGMTPEAIEAALQVVNATQCERPGPPANIHKIAMSTGRWER
jgi:putative DNA primase/helicase